MWDNLNLDASWVVNEDGWILSTAMEERLAWVPSTISHVLLDPHNVLIISRNASAAISFTRCRLGSSWRLLYSLLMLLEIGRRVLGVVKQTYGVELMCPLTEYHCITPGNVVLGLGFYGRSFTLADPSCTNAGCVFTSGARGGSCTQSVGTLSYAEIERLVAGGARVIRDEVAAVKMVVYDTDQWVSYDDAETLKMKVDYANAHCLGGTMV